MDAENAELCPEAIELHLAGEAVYELSRVFRRSRGCIGVWEGVGSRSKGSNMGKRKGGQRLPQSRGAVLMIRK